MSVRTFLGQNGWRMPTAISICALSAAWCGIVVALGTDHVPRDIASVAGAWGAVAMWLDDFRGLRKTPAQIYQQAREGRLRRSRLHRIIGSGSLIFFLLAIVCLFR